jgi:two-component system cell cycle response regulator
MNNFDIDPYHALKSLLEVTSPHLGESFLKVVCHELKKLFDADMVFITEAINSNPTTKVKILYATNSNLPDSFELEGTPCQLVFEDKIIQINKRLNLEFDKAKTTSFESFYGIPLHSKDSLCIGHIGIFSEKKRIIPNYIEDIALIFARRIEVEYQREILEKENIKIYIELKEMIITDSLTGLFNRRHFNAISKDTLLQIKRDIIIASLSYLDIDNFKTINDTYGHDKGDEVLKYLSDLLQKNTREGIDYLFRVGGEEFAIISINSSLQDSYLHLERIQNTLVNDKDNSLNITLSVGIDVFAKDDKSFDAVCKRADIKMYKAKNSGKNCIVT